MKTENTLTFKGHLTLNPQGQNRIRGPTFELHDHPTNSTAEISGTTHEGKHYYRITKSHNGRVWKGPLKII